MLVVSWFNGLYEVIILWNQGRFPSALRPRKAQTRAPWAFGYQGAGAKGPRCNTAIGSSVGTSLIIYSVKPGIVDYLVYHDNQIFPLQAGCIPMISHVNTNIKPQKKLQGNPTKSMKSRQKPMVSPCFCKIPMVYPSSNLLVLTSGDVCGSSSPKDDTTTLSVI